ncbi:peroxidase 47-like [Oryza glaberrima]|uniref:peroxidase 47-like n=1 Tax=Oryza glaberrima TaxID=4538 RepID=UPI00224C3A83|nr:peroxidase 47-like [Oryza glaberrima]
MRVSARRPAEEGRIEAACPGVISCADIVAFTGHDASSANFAAKGFTPEELVILSGAYSIGKAHCFSFNDRLTEPNSEINADYHDNVLNKTCYAAPNETTLANNIRDIDVATLGPRRQRSTRRSTRGLPPHSSVAAPLRRPPLLAILRGDRERG